jgi:hypothetical protein
MTFRLLNYMNISRTLNNTLNKIVSINNEIIIKTNKIISSDGNGIMIDSNINFNNNVLGNINSISNENDIFNIESNIILNGYDIICNNVRANQDITCNILNYVNLNPPIIFNNQGPQIVYTDSGNTLGSIIISNVFDFDNYYNYEILLNIKPSIENTITFSLSYDGGNNYLQTDVAVIIQSIKSTSGYWENFQTFPASYYFGNEGFTITPLILQNVSTTIKLYFTKASIYQIFEYNSMTIDSDGVTCRLVGIFSHQCNSINVTNLKFSVNSGNIEYNYKVIGYP